MQQKRAHCIRVFRSISETDVHSLPMLTFPLVLMKQAVNLNQDKYVSERQIIPAARSAGQINFVKERIDQRAGDHSFAPTAVGLRSQTPGTCDHRTWPAHHSARRVPRSVPILSLVNSLKRRVTLSVLWLQVCPAARLSCSESRTPASLNFRPDSCASWTTVSQFWISDATA